MKRLAAAASAVVLIVLLATPVAAKRGASIDAGAGPFAFGTVADVVEAWEGQRRDVEFGYWHLAECVADESTITPTAGPGPIAIGQPVYRQYVMADRPFTLGPTPSWEGGGADCTVHLGYWFGGGRWVELASDVFEVGG